MNWILENQKELISALFALIGVLEIVVRLTPSEKDNSILKKITNVLFFLFPNKKKGGGLFK